MSVWVLVFLAAAPDVVAVKAGSAVAVKPERAAQSVAQVRAQLTAAGATVVESAAHTAVVSVSLGLEAIVVKAVLDDGLVSMSWEEPVAGPIATNKAPQEFATRVVQALPKPTLTPVAKLEPEKTPPAVTLPPRPSKVGPFVVLGTAGVCAVASLSGLAVALGQGGVPSTNAADRAFVFPNTYPTLDARNTANTGFQVFFWAGLAAIGSGALGALLLGLQSVEP